MKYFNGVLLLTYPMSINLIFNVPPPTTLTGPYTFYEKLVLPDIRTTHCVRFPYDTTWQPDKLWVCVSAAPWTGDRGLGEAQLAGKLAQDANVVRLSDVKRRTHRSFV